MSKTRRAMTRPQQMLLSLVRSGIWRSAPEKALFEGAGEELWRSTASLAAAQGVGAIAFDGMAMLPPDIQPPRMVQLEWGVRTDTAERIYARQTAVAEELASVFGQEGIKMLLLKGMGLARLYPVPAHRESGDVDIYLFGRHGRGEEILAEMGKANAHGVNLKHSESTYKGILVENHRTLLDVATLSPDAYLNATLLEILDSDAELSSAPADKILFPCPDFDMIFLMRHALMHLGTQEMVLRQLCDIALFLQANRGAIDFDGYRRAMARTRLTRAADTVVAAAVEYLGLDPRDAPPYAGQDTARLMREILSVRPKITGSPARVAWLRTKKFFSKHYVYPLVYPGGYAGIVWRTVKEKLADPRKACTPDKR